MIAVSPFGFSLRATDGRARLGTLTTPHGEVETPAFMPVGTQGSVKATLHRDLEGIGAAIILGNTYHLFLRPATSGSRASAACTPFIGWDRPILTDSGGYQVFSLAERRVIREEGAEFQSHLDGSRHLLSPSAPPTSRPASGRTSRWCSTSACVSVHARGGRAVDGALGPVGGPLPARLDALRQGPPPDVAVTNPGQAQFGIVQGGVFQDLRDASATPRWRWASRAMPSVASAWASRWT
jgi:queuine tRNA-ribosyltransferase